MAPITLDDAPSAVPAPIDIGTFTDLLTRDGYNPKTDKGHARNYATAVLYLAPSDASGVLNVCQFASLGCKSGCLYSAGRGGFDPEVPAARINRTRLFRFSRFAFNERLVREIDRHLEKAASRGMRPCVRLNGTSDLPWEKLRLNDGRTVLETYPDVQFYDYTKNVRRALANAAGEHPSNYHLTFSRSETNEDDCVRVLRAGGNVAVVFNARTKHSRRPADPLPETWHGYRVIDADTDDLRFLDPANVIAGLRAKGPAKSDTFGFVVDIRSAACHYSAGAPKAPRAAKAAA